MHASGESNFKLFWLRVAAGSPQALQKSSAVPPQCRNGGAFDVYISCSTLTSLRSLSIFASNSTPIMRQTLFTEEEIRLATERRLKYLGAAKVNIYQIQFDPPLPRDLDPKNLDRLREVFRKNRCRRLDIDNHVPATVSRQDLADALRKANVP